MSAKGKRPSSPWQVRTGKQILKQVEDSVFLHYIEFRRASAILNSAQYLSDAQKQRALFVRYCCRSPHGERGLKLDDADYDIWGEGRSPHGERGLKY